MNKKIVKCSELKLGDVICIANSDGTDTSGSPFPMVVVKVDEANNEVSFFRPYVHVSNFEYTGGIIPYIGIENFSCPRDWHSQYVWKDNIYRPPHVIEGGAR